MKTYVDFGLDKDPKEEYKIDPLTQILETMATCGKGEHFWYQVLIQDESVFNDTKVPKMYINPATHEHVSLADLKGILAVFIEEFFGRPMQVRFRPSYFPFTEPSVEIDIGWTDANGKVEKWIEVMGAGQVHPKVLKAGGIDSDKWQGFAFGGGVDRFLMLKYGVTDVRMLYTGDLRVITQFGKV
jgi:hypothetical protein